MNIDKRLLEHIAEKVSQHKFTRLIDDISQLQYCSPKINQCSYCHMPHNRNECYTCYMSWCGREYFCAKPLDNRGVISVISTTSDDNTCGRGCIACYKKCFNCDQQGCGLKHIDCPIIRCYSCKKYACKSHHASERVQLDYQYGYNHLYIKRDDYRDEYYCNDCNK
jgi:hypothetical protein